MKPHASTFATAEDASLGLDGPAPSSEATRIRLLPLLLAIAVMLGITILVGALTILFNLVVDVLYGWIDPKIRY